MATNTEYDFRPMTFSVTDDPQVFIDTDVQFLSCVTFLLDGFSDLD